MTQEEKLLLLRVLCAGLPYGVKAQCGSSETNIGEIVDVNVQSGEIKTRTNTYDIEHVKPCLRPISSMSEEEQEEYLDLVVLVGNDILAYAIIKEEKIRDVIDFYVKHHFDYCGLIEKGLALEAPEGMYKF